MLLLLPKMAFHELPPLPPAQYTAGSYPESSTIVSQNPLKVSRSRVEETEVDSSSLPQGLFQTPSDGSLVDQGKVMFLFGQGARPRAQDGPAVRLRSWL
jgi:hypothetical protein